MDKRKVYYFAVPVPPTTLYKIDAHYKKDDCFKHLGITTYKFSVPVKPMLLFNADKDSPACNFWERTGLHLDLEKVRILEMQDFLINNLKESSD